MCQKRPRRVANAQAVDRLTAVWDVRRRVDESADVGSAAGGVGDHEPAVGVSHKDLVSRDRIERRPHDRHVARHRIQAERRRRRPVAVLVQRVGHPVPIRQAMRRRHARARSSGPARRSGAGGESREREHQGGRDEAPNRSRRALRSTVTLWVRPFIRGSPSGRRDTAAITSRSPQAVRQPSQTGVTRTTPSQSGRATLDGLIGGVASPATGSAAPASNRQLLLRSGRREVMGDDRQRPITAIMLRGWTSHSSVGRRSTVMARWWTGMPASAPSSRACSASPRPTACSSASTSSSRASRARGRTRATAT